MNKNLIFCRRLFSERALKTAVRLGVKQCVFFDAKNNMFAYRKPTWAENLYVFELCRRNDILEKLQYLEEKQMEVPNGTYYIEWYTHTESWVTRLCECTAYRRNILTFCDLMGLSAKLSKEAFASCLAALGNLMASGSSVVFDYNEDHGEAFLDGYSYRELEQIVSRCGYRIYEHVSSREMLEQYLRMHNLIKKNKIIPPCDVSYCLAVKK